MKKIYLLFVVVVAAFVFFIYLAPRLSTTAKQCKRGVAEREFLELAITSLKDDLSVVKAKIEENEKTAEFLTNKKEVFISLVKKIGLKWDEENEKKYNAYIQEALDNKKALAGQENVLQEVLNEKYNNLLKIQIPEI